MIISDSFIDFQTRVNLLFVLTLNIIHLDITALVPGRYNSKALVTCSQNSSCFLGDTHHYFYECHLFLFLIIEDLILNTFYCNFITLFNS